jgi:polyisoprenoid-binding protein YceI
MSCKLRALTVALLAMLLAGCPVRTRVPSGAAVRPPQAAVPHLGVPYDIVAAESLLTIRVYRGGTLASVGHNHLIACHTLRGTVYVPADITRTSFEARMVVAELTVDEAELREQEMSADFPPQVPQTAREGTRRNMLSEALLDAVHSPEIALRGAGLERGAPSVTANESSALAQLDATVRGQTHTLSVTVRYQLDAGELVASGETPLRQSELGLTPFSTMLGALQVQDEMRVKFRIVARVAPGATGSRP